MSFKDMVAADNHSTFLNLAEFAEKRTIKYDGEIFVDIPIVLTGRKEKDRRVLVSDHVQGLFLVTDILHCAMSDLGANNLKRDPVSASTTRRAAVAISVATMLLPLLRRWVCSVLNWRRSANECGSD